MGWVRASFADDQICGGVATMQQTGTATATMNVSSTTYIRLSSFGISEAQYETMTFRIGGNELLRVQGQNNNFCQVSTCSMCTVGTAEQVLRIAPGLHPVEV